MIRKKINTKGEKRNARINKDKIGLAFQPGDLVLVKACNAANAAAGKVAKFLALYEVLYWPTAEIQVAPLSVKAFESVGRITLIKVQLL